jgi:hypothetical protein
MYCAQGVLYGLSTSWVIYTRAELVQPHAAIEVAARKAPGVRDRPSRTGQIAVRIIRIDGDQHAITVREPDDGDQFIEEVKGGRMARYG